MVQACETNSAESFGLKPGEPGYDTFERDFPLSSAPSTYDQDHIEIGVAPPNSEAGPMQEVTVTT